MTKKALLSVAGAALLLAVIIPAVSLAILSDDGDRPTSPASNGDNGRTTLPGGTPVPSNMTVVPAPIESVEVAVAESYPPQYFLHVVSGLPSGCARFNEYKVERSGERITVTMTNLLPADKSVICTAIYGMVNHNIALGSDFDPGVTYTITVNDKTIDLKAQ